MKIDIVTVYDSLNYGSFFQAFASAKELEQYGVVRFLDIKHQSIIAQTIERVFKDCVRIRFNSAILELKKLINFQKAHSYFHTIQSANIEKDDYVFFGSDEIWNISRKKMKRSKEFFGVGIESKHKFSLAPSINMTTLSQLQDNSYIQEALSKFSAISVRDEYTKECIDTLIDGSSILVSDPTMMFPKEFYMQYQKDVNYKDYILLYTYGTMLTDKNIFQIKSFSKENNLKIVSIGKWYDFCDICLSPSPYEFLSFVNNAKYIFTDTFHGTVFSIIYEKEFVSFALNNTKVFELLDELELNDRVVSETNLKSIVNSSINYSKVTSMVSNYGNKTKKYLRDIFIEEC